MFKQKLACSRYQSYIRWISAIYMTTNQPTLPWLSPKPPPPKTPATTSSKNSRQQRSRSTSRPPEGMRSPIKRLGERRKTIDIWINNGTRVEKTLALLLPSSLIAELRKTCSRSRALTVTRKRTTQKTALSAEKTCQKTSIGLGNSTSIIDTSKEATLKRVWYIWYLVWFHQKNDKDKDKHIRALIDSRSKVNLMHHAYTIKLDPSARKIDLGIQKIDGSHLDIFEMVIANYSVKNKLERVRFF